MATATAHMLVESLDLSDVKVDRENFVIRGVKLSGRRSRNLHKKYRKPILYSDRSIQQSASVFEECPVTVVGGHDRTRRDGLSQNGVLRSGRVEHLGTEQAASRYDWHLNSADLTTPKILEDAVKFPGNIPLSQEVLEWTESLDDKGNVLIESLTDDPLKIGVALVYRGGLNNSLFESLSPEDDQVEIKTKEELAARFPSLCEELTECACQQAKTASDDLKAQLTTAIAEREAMKAELEKLKGQLEEYKAEEARVEHIAEIATEAKKVLGEKYEVDTELMETLLGLYEDEGYKKVLTTMGKLMTSGIVEETDEDETPSSSSGTAGGKRNNHTAVRRRVGIHNRRF